MNPGSQLTCQ